MSYLNKNILYLIFGFKTICFVWFVFTFILYNQKTDKIKQNKITLDLVSRKAACES